MIPSRLVADHFRLRARYPLVLRVTLRRPHDRGVREIVGQTENVGFGGAFVEVDPPLPVDTRILVSIASATTWEPIVLPSVVRWVRDARPGARAGMGVAFDPLAPEHALALHRLIAAHGFDEG